MIMYKTDQNQTWFAKRPHRSLDFRSSHNRHFVFKSVRAKLWPVSRDMIFPCLSWTSSWCLAERGKNCKTAITPFVDSNRYFGNTEVRWTSMYILLKVYLWLILLQVRGPEFSKLSHSSILRCWLLSKTSATHSVPLGQCPLLWWRMMTAPWSAASALYPTFLTTLLSLCSLLGSPQVSPLTAAVPQSLLVSFSSWPFNHSQGVDWLPTNAFWAAPMLCGVHAA